MKKLLTILAAGLVLAAACKKEAGIDQKPENNENGIATPEVVDLGLGELLGGNWRMPTMDEFKELLVNKMVILSRETVNNVPCIRISMMAISPAA